MSNDAVLHLPDALPAPLTDTSARRGESDHDRFHRVVDVTERDLEDVRLP